MFVSPRITLSILFIISLGSVFPEKKYLAARWKFQITSRYWQLWLGILAQSFSFGPNTLILIRPLSPPPPSLTFPHPLQVLIIVEFAIFKIFLSVIACGRRYIFCEGSDDNN